MSNCVDINRGKFVLSVEEIAIGELMTTLRAHVGHDSFKAHDERSDDYVACSMAKWFLVPDQNIEILETGRLRVNFGRGRSVHTWRDFRATCLFLSRYMKCPIRHRFLVKDEDSSSFGPFDVLFEHYAIMFGSEKLSAKE